MDMAADHQFRLDRENDFLKPAASRVKPSEHLIQSAPGRRMGNQNRVSTQKRFQFFDGVRLSYAYQRGKRERKRAADTHKTDVLDGRFFQVERVNI